MQLVHQHGGSQEGGRQVLDLGTTAAGHQRDDGTLCRQPQRLAGSGLIGLEGDLVGQRMAAVGGGDAGLAVDGFLEGKDQQHVVHRLADLLDALASPGPDGRTDEMIGAHAGSPQPGFQPQVEVGGIHADEGLGGPAQQPLAELAAYPQQARQCLEGFGVAMDSQPFGRPPGLEALGLHARAANAGTDRAVRAGRWGQRKCVPCPGRHGCVVRLAGGKRGAGSALPAPAGQHRSRQQVAGGLAGHHADAGRGHGAAQRAMPRVASPRKRTSGPRHFSWVASVAAWACSVSRASASVSPCR